MAEEIQQSPRSLWKLKTIDHLVRDVLRPATHHVADVQFSCVVIRDIGNWLAAILKVLQQRRFFVLFATQFDAYKDLCVSLIGIAVIELRY